MTITSICQAFEVFWAAQFLCQSGLSFQPQSELCTSTGGNFALSTTNLLMDSQPLPFSFDYTKATLFLLTEQNKVNHCGNGSRLETTYSQFYLTSASRSRSRVFAPPGSCLVHWTKKTRKNSEDKHFLSYRFVFCINGCEKWPRTTGGARLMFHIEFVGSVWK